MLEYKKIIKDEVETLGVRNPEIYTYDFSGGTPIFIKKL